MATDSSSPFVFLKFSAMLPVALLAAGLSSAAAAERVYTAPVLPEGILATAFPTERQEWFQRVQAKFDKTQGKQFDLVFDGDSIIAGWEWPERGLSVLTQRYGKISNANFGIAGDEVQNVLWRLKHGQMDGIDPKLVILMVGTNNIQWDAPEKVADGVQVLIAEYLKDAPRAQLLLLGLTPRGAKADDSFREKVTKLNSLLAANADGKRVSYLDMGPSFLNSDGTQIADLFAPDGVHPTTKGYTVWADAMQAEIDKVFTASH